MSAESFLSSIIEAAVGMAGFAGIIAAIRQRNIAHWPPVQRILLSILLLTSAMAIVFALLPALLTEAQIPAPTIWRIGSGSIVVWQSYIIVHRTRQFRAIELSTTVPRFIFVLTVVSMLLQALNLVLGVSWPYLLGVFGLLINGFTVFLVMLLGSNAANQTESSGDAAR